LNPSTYAPTHIAERYRPAPITEDSPRPALDVDAHLSHGVPVTTPPEPESEMPWLQPTTEVPAQPNGRRRIIVLLLPVVGLIVLCCGGAALTTSMFRGDKPKAGAPTLVIPSSPASVAPQPPAPTASPPSPTPSSPPTSRTPKPHRTTHKPKPTTKPTTTRPKPSPSATSGGIQQDVRVGQFCAPRGAFGLTRRGQVVRCGPSVDDPRNRWRPMI
jgi:hypothetical protein